MSSPEGKENEPITSAKSKVALDLEHLQLIQEGLADYEAGDVSEGFDDMNELLAFVNG